MKINKWTLGLAAVGLVSLASVAQAEEKTVPLLTAVSQTTISGYVDVSAVWNPGTGNANVAPYAFNAGKQDGFNLNALDIKLAKPLEEGQWSSGYVAELTFGPDAGVALAGAAPIRQAYVAVRVPIGNGLDFKLGRFDSILGYESTDGYKNPNYTRSYGYTISPTEHTGILAEYKFGDVVSIAGGVANTDQAGVGTGGGGVNARSTRAESHKTYMGAITVTAPESMGALAGSALYAGFIDGFGSPAGAFTTQGPGLGSAKAKNEIDVYVGATIATPLKGLRLGAAYNEAHNFAPAVGVPVNLGYVNTYAGYASFQATEKLSMHLRGEYAHAGFGKVLAATATLQYDLWQNVISRLEVRWDHYAGGNTTLVPASTPFGGTVAGAGTKKNEVMVAANLVYKF
jgi:hypothetical protein